MTRLEEIESAVTDLTPEDLSKFRRWFDSFAARRWDAEIESDMISGKLDRLADAAIADVKADRARPL